MNNTSIKTFYALDLQVFEPTAINGSWNDSPSLLPPPGPKSKGPADEAKFQKLCDESYPL